MSASCICIVSATSRAVFIAVVTNCLLIGYTSNVFETLTSTEKLIIVVAIEHLFIVIKYVIGLAVPTRPGIKWQPLRHVRTASDMHALPTLASRLQRSQFL